MTVGLLVSLAALGLVSVDVIGIAAMPILLTQKRPFVRSFTFLGGGFVALIMVGFVLARGLGVRVLRFDKSHSWLVPSAEVLAGIILLIIAVTILWQLRAGRVSAEPSSSIVERLRLGDGQLFMLGAVIVTFQSVADVVFVIAMIRVGQLNLSVVGLLAAAGTYAIAALALQVAVVVAYWLAPETQRLRTLDKIHGWLVSYANQVLIGVSLVLGSALLVAGLLGFYR